MPGRPRLNPNELLSFTEARRSESSVSRCNGEQSAAEDDAYDRQNLG
jgi:hypothetical protein